MVQSKSQYELESGVVVIDKLRHIAGLLAACLLNAPGPLKDMIREETHGEKETFWIGLEMANEPYSFMPNLPGALGTLHKNDADGVMEVCGKLAHFGRDGDLLWFNDAIAMGKLPDDDTIREVSDFTHFARESEGVWENLCLRGKHHKLDSLTRVLLERLKNIYRFNPRNLYNPKTITEAQTADIAAERSDQ
jgi:hypothetical protein